MRADASDHALAILGSTTRAVVYVMLAAPALIVVATSFTSGQNLRFPPHGFSLRWYVAAFASPQFMGSLWASTWLACMTTIIAMVTGFAAAFAIDRYRFRGREAFQSLVLSPLVIPAVALGLALLQTFAVLGLNQSVMGLLIAHVLIALPYVVRILTAGLAVFDRTLELAAMNLRARPATVLRRITLPLLLPAFMSAAIFAFVASFGNVTLTVFLRFPGFTTLPVQIFSYVEYDISPVLAAVSTLVILVTLGVLFAIERIIGVKNVV